MEAIVLAGGFGTRLRKVVSDLPKPMAPVAGRPFLEILLKSLEDKGFCHVVLSLGYMADVVVSHFGEHFGGIELSYEIEEEPLGTGGAIRQALAHCKEDHVFVFNGDTFLDLEVDEVELKWQQKRTPIIVACNVGDASRYGRLDIKNGHVVGFSEKGVLGGGLVNAGCYVLPIDIFENTYTEKKFSFETDYLVDASILKSFIYFESKAQFIDIGVPEDYLRAQHLFKY